MVMIIVMSQSKLLQRDTSVYRCCTQVTEALLTAFHTYVDVVFVV